MTVVDRLDEVQASSDIRLSELTIKNSSVLAAQFIMPIASHLCNANVVVRLHLCRQLVPRGRPCLAVRTVRRVEHYKHCSITRHEFMERFHRQLLIV